MKLARAIINNKYIASSLLVVYAFSIDAIAPLEQRKENLTTLRTALQQYRTLYNTATTFRVCYKPNEHKTLYTEDSYEGESAFWGSPSANRILGIAGCLSYALLFLESFKHHYYRTKKGFALFFTSFGCLGIGTYFIKESERKPLSFDQFVNNVMTQINNGHLKGCPKFTAHK